MSKKISSRLTAVAFVAALTLAGAAEAGPLARSAGPEASPWSLAWSWLAEVWGDLTGLQSATTSQGIPAGGSPQGGDVGCGIDPNGLPCGDNG